MLDRLRPCLPHFVMLLVSIALYAAAMRIDTGSTGGGGRIGPDFWPKAVIVFMGLLCLYEIVKRALLGSNFSARGLTDGLTRNPADEDAAAPPPAADAPEPEYPRLLLAGAALILGYVLAVSWLGFFVTTALFLGGFARIGGFRRHGWNLLISLVGALLMVVLFMRVAYISLPLGEGVFRSLSIGLLRLLGVN